MIYLDNMATTPVDPRVLEVMLPFFQERFGNAASRHAAGQAALEAVGEARRQVASLIGADPDDVIFTSGATESDNLALKGVVEARGFSSSHVITAVTEHKAILDTCHALERRGCEVTYLPVDSQGLIDPEDLRRAITSRTVLVSIMLANNEIGVIQPIEALARIAHERGCLFHTDAAQGAGKIPFDFPQSGVDLASLTAHKMNGPKGVGALFVRRDVAIELQMHGGGHEGNRRSGTLNVPGIVALGEACELCKTSMEVDHERILALRNRLWRRLKDCLPEIKLNGHPEARIPGNLNICFGTVDGEALMDMAPDVAVSSGAACNSGSTVPSYVLMAIGLTYREARSSIRFGIGRFNTEAEIDEVAERFIGAVGKLQRISPLTDDERRLGGGSLSPPGRPVGIGWVERPDEGASVQVVVRFSLQTNRIEEARFRAFGCTALLECADAVTEQARGKSIEAALEADPDSLAAELSVPVEKHYCAIISVEALRKAVLNLKTRLVGTDKANAEAAETVAHERAQK